MSTTNPPVNQAVNPANAPVNDTRIAHHSHEKSIEKSATHQSNNATTSGHLDTNTTHDKEKGGLMHNLFHPHGASSKNTNIKHDKHHAKRNSNNQSLTSSHGQNTNQANITNNHILDAGINTVRNRHSNTGVLASSLSNYSNQLAALNQTRQRIAAAFAAVLSEQNSPYTQLAQEYSQAELSLVRNQATIPDRMVDQTYQDFDRRQSRINELSDMLNKQRSSVDHYNEKLTKLFHDRDTSTSSGKTLSTKELERLERNQVKARDAELAYNQTNSQLIEEINHLGTAPVQQLGPALISFISGEQMRAAQTNAALSKIIIDAETINSRADMWARSQPHVVAPNTGASHIHGLTTNVRDRSASGWTASSTAAAASAPVSTTDQHRHSTSHSTSHSDKHHSDKDASHNKDVRSMTDAMGTTMIRSEEQLAVGLERVVTEQVRMHKYVTSEIINVPITLRKEHISIERVHLHDKDRRNSVSNNGNLNTATSTSTTGHHDTSNTSSGHHSLFGGHGHHNNKTDNTLNRSGAIAPTGAAANTQATSSTLATNTLAGSASSTNSGLTNVPSTGLHGHTTSTTTTSNTGLYGTGSNTNTGLHGTNTSNTGLHGTNANISGTGLQGSSLSAASNSILDADVAGEWDFVLSAEQPVIATRVVPYERVRVRKIADHTTQRISTDLRKENIDFTLQPNLANQGQPEVAIRDIDPAMHRAHKGEVVECMDGNGLVNQTGSGAQQAQAGGLYNKDQSALQTGNTSTYDKTQQSSQLTNQQRAVNDGRPLERV